MQTQINGKAAAWTAEIHAKWETAVADWAEADPRKRDPARVTQSNYFTPRPYVDQYNRGSETEGFTFTVDSGSAYRGPEVWQTIIARTPIVGARGR